MIPLSDRDKLVQKASSLVARAIKRGELPKVSTLICTDCGKQAQCYDHRDYNKPLDVVPVCKGCNNRRGPGLPLPEKTDGRDYKLDWFDGNSGKSFSAMDQGEGFIPLSARLIGIDQIDLEVALERQNEIGSFELWKRLDQIREQRKNTITARDRNRFIGAIPGVARANYFKEHDPWFVPFF